MFTTKIFILLEKWVRVSKCPRQLKDSWRGRRGFKVEVRTGVRERVGIVLVSLRSWGMDHVSESPHKVGNARSVCVDGGRHVRHSSTKRQTELFSTYYGHCVYCVMC